MSSVPTGELTFSSIVEFYRFYVVLRYRAEADLDLPRIAVIGSQGVGKVSEQNRFSYFPLLMILYRAR